MAARKSHTWRLNWLSWLCGRLGPFLEAEEQHEQPNQLKYEDNNRQELIKKNFMHQNLWSTRIYTWVSNTFSSLTFHPRFNAALSFLLSCNTCTFIIIFRHRNISTCRLLMLQLTFTTSLDSIREAKSPWLIINGQVIKSKIKIWPEIRPITARVT